MHDILTINENRIFRRAYHKGKQMVSPVLVTYVMKNRLNLKRIGIVTSKKIGKAVKRNRARRVIKEAYRLLSKNLTSGYDFIFIARGKTPFVKMGAVMKEMTFHMKKMGFYDKKGTD